MYKIIIFLLFLLLIPDLSLAEGGPSQFVTCNGTDCDTCDLVEMFNAIIKWLIGFMFLIFAILIFVAGFKMVISAGNSSALEEAKSSMSNAFIGIVIVFASWIIVNTLMNALISREQTNVIDSWSRIKCIRATPVSTSATTQTGGSAQTGTRPAGGQQASAGCSTCAAIPDGIPTNGNECASGYTCMLHPDMTSRLNGVDLVEDGLRVSEAWPPTGYSATDPTGVHESVCHGDATCIDVSFNKDNPSASEINRFISKSANSNLVAEYEVKTPERLAELKSAGVEHVILVPRATREHFSVYMCDKTTNYACDRAK